MSKQKHTPGKLYYDDTWGLIMGGQGKCQIAAVHASPPEVTTATAKANAARLVHCWNCHDELVAALEDMRKQLREHVKMDVKKHYSLMVADAAAGTAIATAKEVK